MLKVKKVVATTIAFGMLMGISVIGASAQAYTKKPEVKSGDLNPFTKDRSIVSVYGCSISAHSTETIYVNSLKLETKNQNGSTKNYLIHSSTWTSGNRENRDAPLKYTQKSGWDDSYTLSARVNCSNSEIYCISCFDDDNTTGYGTGDGTSPWATE
jgi:hypothetical protein